MPKKIAENSKAVEARERKAAAASDKKQKEAKAREDALWADEGPQGKSAKKRAEEEKKKQEAAAKRAELEKLKKEEESEMSLMSKKGVKGPKGDPAAKMTRAELDKIKEQDERQRAERERQRQKAIARVAEEDEYERIVNVANTNRMEAQVDARSLGEAVSQLSHVVLDEQAAMDKHPEKRVRAAYKAYEEAELARLRAERPGLTLTQYKEQVWKSWKKAPQNPLNQMPGR